MARQSRKLSETIVPTSIDLQPKFDFDAGSVIKRPQHLPFETDALLPLRVVRGGANSAADYRSPFENSKSALKKMAGRGDTRLNVKFEINGSDVFADCILRDRKFARNLLVHQS